MMIGPVLDPEMIRRAMAQISSTVPLLGSELRSIRMQRKRKTKTRFTVGGVELHPTKGYYGAKKRGNRSNRT